MNPRQPHITSLQPTTTDFALLRSHAEYIDNTLLIDALEESSYGSNAILMPGGFFKSSALSMLKFFYDSDLQAGEFFKNTYVMDKPRTLLHQGQYTVIHLDCSDLRGETWETMLSSIKEKISFLYQKHLEKHLVGETPDTFTERQRIKIKDIITKNSDDWSLNDSLLSLAEYIHIMTKKRVVILVDDIDVPLIEAEIHGYFLKCISFFHILYAHIVHDVPYCIYRSVLMGKCHYGFYKYGDSIYSTVHRQALGQYFGLTQKHISKILSQHKLPPDTLKILTENYGGYTFNGITMHHPASTWAGMEALTNAKPLPPTGSLLSQHSSKLLRKLLAAQNITPFKLKKLLENCAISNIGALLRKTLDPTNRINEESMFMYLVYFGLLTNWVPTSTRKNTEDYKLMIPNRSAFNLIKLHSLNPEEPIEFVDICAEVKLSDHAELNSIATELESNDTTVVSKALLKVNDFTFIDKQNPMIASLCKLAQSINSPYRQAAWKVFSAVPHNAKHQFINSLIPRVTNPSFHLASECVSRLSKEKVRAKAIDVTNIKSVSTVLAQSYRQGGFFFAYTSDQVANIASRNRPSADYTSDKDALEIASSTVKRHLPH